MRHACFLILILGCVFFASGQSSPQLTASCLNTNAPLAPILEKLLLEAGFPVKMLVLPAERSFQMMNHGDLDLEFFRTDLSFTGNPHLLKIAVPLSRVEYRAYTEDPNITIRNLADLKNYSVGYARGNKTLETLLAGLNTQEGLTTANLIQMMKLGRVDAVVTNQITYQYYINQNPAVRLIPQEPPLLVEHAYGVLHKSKAWLLPRLEEVFKGWVSSGRWQKELQAVLDHPQ